jgi:hypothetical protein
MLSWASLCISATYYLMNDIYYFLHVLYGIMVLELMSKRVNMVNVGHGVMELALLSKKVNMVIING